MSELDKHMDDAFKRMNEEIKVSYDSSFWDAAKAKLDDSSLDDAFRTAASSVVVDSTIDIPKSIDDAFMDSAFVEASAEQSVNYDASYFEQFMENQSDLVMDNAFVEAAGATTVDYMPHFWNDADQALTEEGLHYEYKSEYWSDAKRLLDRSDRRIFFTRWTAVAVALLLISFGGQQYLSTDINSIHGHQFARNVNDNGLIIETNQVETESTVKEADVVEGNELINTGFNHTSNASHENLHNIGNSSTGNDTETAVNLIESATESVISLDLGDAHSQGQEERNRFNVDPSRTSLIGVQSEDKDVEDSEEQFDIDNLSSPTIESIFYEKRTPKIKIEKIKPRTVHSLSVVGAGGVGNKYGEFSFLPTLRSSFGVEYLASSAKRLKNFEIGGSFMINHVKQNNLRYEDRTTEYNEFGGVNKHFRSVAMKNILYANANFLLNHRISPKHKMKFGVGCEYLIAANSNMSYFNNKVKDVTIVNDNWGVKEGLNKFDVRLMVGYEYQISNAFALQLNTNYGVFDRTDDFYLKSNEKNVELGIMLGLKYNIFRGVK
jgi:hypothetical protein